MIASWFAPVANPVSDYWRRNTDPLSNPFKGLYQANTFDLAVMLPYFIVLVVLAAYGIHRYALVYNFYKYRNIAPPPPGHRVAKGYHTASHLQ